MRDGMKEAGLSEPEFEFSSFFTVTLRKKAMIKVPWTRELNIRPDKLQRIIAILQVLISTNKLDVDGLAKKYHTTTRNIRKDLELLQEKDWIIGIGATKNKSYQITETGRQKAALIP